MNQTQILISFVTFFAGAILALALNHFFIIQVHTTSNNEMIRSLVIDVKKSEIAGGLSILDQCKDKGIAYIRTLDGNTGYQIICDESTISVIDDERVIRMNLEARDYASKRMNTRF